MDRPACSRAGAFIRMFDNTIVHMTAFADRPQRDDPAGSARRDGMVRACSLMIIGAGPPLVKGGFETVLPGGLPAPRAACLRPRPQDSGHRGGVRLAKIGTDVYKQRSPNDLKRRHHPSRTPNPLFGTHPGAAVGGGILSVPHAGHGPGFPPHPVGSVRRGRVAFFRPPQPPRSGKPCFSIPG